jgi:uncharacterized membrane protein
VFLAASGSGPAGTKGKIAVTGGLMFGVVIILVILVAILVISVIIPIVFKKDKKK